MGRGTPSVLIVRDAAVKAEKLCTVSTVVGLHAVEVQVLSQGLDGSSVGRLERGCRAS